MRNLVVAVAAIVIPLLATDARADQCAWVSGEVAQRAKEALRPGKRVIDYCEPCKGKHRGTRRPKKIAKVEVKVIKSRHTAEVFHEVVVNGRGVDLAYLFLESPTSSQFDNVALKVGCPARDVSATLDPE
jgi:hypothetical protein